MTNVVFDFGNVLKKWEPERVLGQFFATPDEMEAVLDQIGFAAWNVEQDRGRDWDEAVEAAAASHPDHAHIFAAYRNGLAEAHDVPIQGTIDIVEELKAAGTALYAITNASHETVRVLRDLYTYPALFLDVVVSAEEGLVKPDPAIFERFLERNGLEAGACVFIDDSPRNIEGARGVGMDAIHFTDPEVLRRELAKRGLPV